MKTNENRKMVLISLTILFLIAWNLNCFGQDTLNTKPTDCNKINTDGRVFIYKNNFLKEKKMHTMLFALNDREINKCVYKANRSKMVQLVCLSLGFSLIGVGSAIVVSSNFSVWNTPLKDSGASNIAVGCFLGGFAFMVACDINYSKKHQHNKQAIKLYNQKFNY